MFFFKKTMYEHHLDNFDKEEKIQVTIKDVGDDLFEFYIKSKNYNVIIKSINYTGAINPDIKKFSLDTIEEFISRINLKNVSLIKASDDVLEKIEQIKKERINKENNSKTSSFDIVRKIKTIRSSDNIADSLKKGNKI